MKGWEYSGVNIPLKLVEKPDPVATEGRVVLDVKAAGLCHSDVGALRDAKWLDIIEKLPVIMGHEVAGIITEVGPGVTDFKVGDKVAVCPVSLLGRGPGYGYDGGYATKTCPPACDLVKIPEGVSFAQAAAGTDAGMSSFHALFRLTDAKAGTKVGIIGIGGLGQMAARAAVVKGMEVYAVDTSANARELARTLGVKDVFENAIDLAEVQPEVIVDYAGFGQTTADALEAIASGGTIVVVGMGKLESTISTNSLILKKAHLVGSRGGDKEDIAHFYELVASGDLISSITEIAFEDIWDGLGRLERHEITGRLVAVM